jgi:arsenite methyltransferase
MGLSLSVDIDQLRSAVRAEYTEVATSPAKGFHFHTGRVLAHKLRYEPADVGQLPDQVVESFAGVANPFVAGRLAPGARVVDLGSGAGLDAILAARQVGPTGRVIGVDMTDSMLQKAQRSRDLIEAWNLDFRKGYAEALPIEDGWADVVISNGAINLCPDKAAVYREVFRVLKPDGRIQIADIVVGKALPDDAKADISLWTG